MRISDWSSDVCSSDLALLHRHRHLRGCQGRKGGRQDALHRPRAALDGGGLRGAREDGLPRGLGPGRRPARRAGEDRSEEHTSELQSLMRISYAVFCLKKKKSKTHTNNNRQLVNQTISMT